MKYELELHVTIRNCVTIICFTILAIYFGKWWISLCSALFLESVKRIPMQYKGGVKNE